MFEFLTHPYGLVSVIMVCVFSLSIVAVVADAMRKTATEKEREESRREIAAYVAEGSLSPVDAERLLNAGPKGRKGRPVVLHGGGAAEATTA